MTLRKASFSNPDRLRDQINLNHFGGNHYIVEWSRHVNAGRYISHEEEFFDEEDAFTYYLQHLDDIAKHHSKKQMIKEVLND